MSTSPASFSGIMHINTILNGKDILLIPILTILFSLGGAIVGINLFVVSGSVQAALTMPIMAPLSDPVGAQRQVAVLAYRLGDAFTNFIVPTSGYLLGALTAAKPVLPVPDETG